MKHTHASVTLAARAIAGNLPITRDTYRQIAVRIWTGEPVTENVYAAITDIGNETLEPLRQLRSHFTNAELNAWFDEVVMSNPEHQEECRAWARSKDWLSQTTEYVLEWQTAAALLPLTRVFVARIK